MTMRDLHRLRPCAVCPTRMAVPGSPVCTTCDAVTIAQLVPSNAAGAHLHPERGRARGCVHCHLAWQVTPGQWITTFSTPDDCEHTTEERPT